MITTDGAGRLADLRACISSVVLDRLFFPHKSDSQN
jgi:hypothetical protein